MTIKITNLTTNEYEIITDVLEYTEHNVVIKAGRGRIYRDFDENYKIEEWEVTDEQQN